MQHVPLLEMHLLVSIQTHVLDSLIYNFQLWINTLFSVSQLCITNQTRRFSGLKTVLLAKKKL